MNKQQADRLILQYQKKIFGFALEKMKEISQAEELASDIICEVYISLLKKDDIINVDGYVYRIARNVYANHVRRLVEGKSFDDINEVLLPYYDKGFEQLENQETLKQLQREISFLSERQRTILYLHYYDKKSVAEIAQKLNISQGTVKWHLSDARSTLKEELMMERAEDTLAVNPIYFLSMGHDGNPGQKGDTQDIFDTQLKQNIAFACYYTPLTVEEIARRLGVPAVYVRDEIQTLYEYGYLDKMDNSKNPRYRTNMYLTDARLFDSTGSERMKEAAKFMCDKFYTQVFAEFDEAEDNWGFFCDGNDKNFMKYALVMLCSNFAYNRTDVKTDYHEKFAVKRPDGGYFIALATVTDNCQEKKADFDWHKYPYWCCEYMNRSYENLLYALQVDCHYSDRSELIWRDNLNTDYEYLYHFIKGGCSPKALAPEQYKRLCDKGYIFEDRVQIMSYKLAAKDNSNLCGDDIWRRMILDHVKVTEEVKAYVKAFDQREYEYRKDKYPEHMQELVKQYTCNAIQSSNFIPYVIEQLLEQRLLKPLTDLQKKSVLTVIAYKE